MITLVKVQQKGQMTIPRRVRSAVGLDDGDLVEVRAVGRKIVITPQLVIDRSKFPTADDYTPAQRRAIDRGIAQSEKEYRRGKGLGPFDTHEAFIASLHREAKKLDSKKNKRAVR
jgi:AbrB family looped-hinge helix DNA binding protein